MLDEKGKELEKHLHMIGWKLRHRGCSYYQIINHNGADTQFQYHSGRIEMQGKSFGNSKYGTHGSLVFELEDCKISHDEDLKDVGIIAKNNLGIWISFYNFSKKRKATNAE